jgi:hypothetical protein
VTLTVTDTSNNVSMATATVTVEDTILPEAIAQDITVILDETGTITITPEDIDNGSNDACGIAILELDITSFDTNDIGENTVQLTVTDTNGNVSTAMAIVNVVKALSINENDLDIGFSVYPNPTTDHVNLKISNFNKENLSYQLYSLHGQLLSRGEIKENITVIGMQRLSMGMYLLKVNLDDREVKSFKIIKK